MKEYDISKLLGGEAVVNCKTEKQTKNLFKYLLKLGFTWEGGDTLDTYNTLYYKHKGETCYLLTSNKTILYSAKWVFIEIGYKVLSLKDIKIKKEKNI